MFLIPSWEPKPFPTLQKWPLNILIVVLCATASYYFVEKPFIRLGHKLAGRYRSRAAEREGVPWPTVAVRADS